MDIKSLIKKGKLVDALNALKGKSDPESYYLAAVIEMKRNNYSLAIKLLKKALAQKRDPKIYHLLGLAYLELLDVENAEIVFRRELSMRESVDGYFFLSLSYLFRDDERAIDALNNAFKIDANRTKRLLSQFYENVLKGRISRERATSIEKKLC